MKLKFTEHNIFLLSLLLKGLNGALELIGSILIVVFPPAIIVRLVNFLTQNEISEDPKDLVANYLIHAFQNYTLGLQTFWSVYFFIHGAIKIFLVVSLLRRRHWAYPAAIIVFMLFIVYQLYRFSFTHSLSLIALSAFDFLVIILTFLEYKILKRTV
ncbi:MAG: DUF2127 domain-containing protein [Patescibacteria group bacterium]|nr:DUF2127 domain-containing protein [Patescibacteria group bacterium]